MVVVLQERPAIAGRLLVGMKRIGKGPDPQGLEGNRHRRRPHLRPLALDKAEQELKRQYLARGKYGVNITTTITPLERNRVGINFNIEEGQVRPRSSRSASSATRTLRKRPAVPLRTDDPGWITWYTKNDQYSRQKLSADLGNSSPST